MFHVDGKERGISEKLNNELRTMKYKLGLLPFP